MARDQALAMRYAIRGFTLIELMITVAIVGILAAIAYPSYLSQTRKSRRADAQSFLMQAANREERVYTTSHEYTDQLLTGNASLNLQALADDTDFFKFSGTTSDNGQSFTIKAQAIGDQTNDTCVTYTLNELGEKKASDASGSDVGDTCW